jgi:hypothetical protein
MRVMASNPKPKQLRPYNPDYVTLTTLFSAKGFEGHASLPINDPDITQKGFYTTYSREALASLFRRWKTARAVDRGDTVPSEWLEEVAPSPVELLGLVLNDDMYFKDEESHENTNTWKDVEAFKIEIGKALHADLLVTVRTSFIEAVTVRAATSSAHLAKRNGAYFKAKIALMTASRSMFLAHLYPPSTSNPPSPPFPHLRVVIAGVFNIFVGSFERAIANAIASTSLPDLSKLLLPDEASLRVSCVEMNEGRRCDIGYVAGWLLRAVQKRRKPLRGTDWASVAGKNSQCSLSPPPPFEYTTKIKRISRGSLLIPNVFFFSFVAYMELFYCKALSSENFLAYGGQILNEAKDVLLASTTFKALVADMLSPIITDTVLTDFAAFCARAYARMRGKDFVRKLLGRTTKKRAGIALLPLRGGLVAKRNGYTERIEEEEEKGGAEDETLDDEGRFEEFVDAVVDADENGDDYPEDDDVEYETAEV